MSPSMPKHHLDTIATTKKELEELEDKKRKGPQHEKDPMVDDEGAFKIRSDDRIKNLFGDKDAFTPSK